MTAPLASDDVRQRLAGYRIDVDDAEALKLAEFLNLLEHWNRVHNLTGIRDRDRLIDRHLVESLALRSLVEGSRAADVGSGGGLPGVPLAICLPAVSFTLIESRRKRASFLRHVAAVLGLDNVTVAHARAEALDTDAFDTVLVRAVAPPDELFAITRRLIAPDGRLVLLTGDDKRDAFIARARGFVQVPVENGAAIRSRIVVLDRSDVS